MKERHGVGRGVHLWLAHAVSFRHNRVHRCRLGKELIVQPGVLRCPVQLLQHLQPPKH